jgi:diadenosine tetraphosphate (Ap4A) HIT family hydrolase
MCPFCHPMTFPGQQVILRNEHCLFLQMPQLVLTSSGVIIPRRHRETVFDLTPEEWTATQSLLQNAKRLIDEQYSPDGYNVGWNCRETGGQSVPHAHMPSRASQMNPMQEKASVTAETGG